MKESCESIRQPTESGRDRPGDPCSPVELLRVYINSQPLQSCQVARPSRKANSGRKLLGKVGGRVRHPMLELIEDEKTTTSAVFQVCGLRNLVRVMAGMRSLSPLDAQALHRKSRAQRIPNRDFAWERRDNGSVSLGASTTSGRMRMLILERNRSLTKSRNGGLSLPPSQAC